jgi:hypothetical protein
MKKNTGQVLIGLALATVVSLVVTITTQVLLIPAHAGQYADFLNIGLVICLSLWFLVRKSWFLVGSFIFLSVCLFPPVALLILFGIGCYTPLHQCFAL